MSKMITKEIQVLAAINEVAWYNQEKDNLSGLSVQARYYLKKNMRTLGVIDNDFQEFKRSMEEELYKEFMNEEKSDAIDLTAEDGTVQPGRQVKEEFREDYQNRLDEVNAKLRDLIMETESVDLYVIDMDAEIERMDANAELSDAAMDMISLFEDDIEVLEGEVE